MPIGANFPIIGGTKTVANADGQNVRMQVHIPLFYMDILLLLLH